MGKNILNEGHELSVFALLTGAGLWTVMLQKNRQGLEYFSNISSKGERCKRSPYGYLCDSDG